MIQDIKRMFRMAPALDRIPVSTLIRVVYGHAVNDSLRKSLLEELQSALQKEECLVGVSNSSGEIEMVFTRQAYQEWARSRRIQGHNEQLAVAGYVQGPASKDILASLRPKVPPQVRRSA